MKKSELIKRIGPDKGGHWKVIGISTGKFPAPWGEIIKGFPSTIPRCLRRGSLLSGQGRGKAAKRFIGLCDGGNRVADATSPKSG